ncbi:MAG: hypothetical protein IKC70_02475 [Bacteroidaceae bacterium]|nr:hypothetical protein [Bacteroidaceae bacterium]
MKKLMIIAVLISGMLMPAQIFAKNDRREVRKENRVSVDYNRAKKNSGKDVKHNTPAPKKQKVVKHHNPAPVVVHHHKPAPQVVVHHHKPAPVVHHVNCAPPPPPVVHHHGHCSEVAGAAAVAVGVVGLISLLAN